MNWYQCKKCGAAIKKESSPNSSGCPSGSYHSWQNLGEVGQNNYQCKKCGLVVQTKSTPSSSGCPSSSYHSWTKL